jgi:hypothetical protein
MISHYLGVVMSFAMLALGVYVAVTFVLQYRSAAKAAANLSPKPTWWQTAISAAINSETILVSQILKVIAAMTSQLDSLADAANLPEAKSVINATVGDPKVLAIIMFAIAFWVEHARKRTLPQ